MIHNVWILLSNSGIPLLTVNYRKLEVEDSLISGFLTAMQAFAKEVTKVNVESVKIGSNNLTFTIHGDVMLVINSDPHDNVLIIRKILRRLTQKFYSMYGDDISAWDVSVYQGFEEFINEVIIEEKFVIKCSVCNKQIISEFIEVETDQGSHYYCCQSCKIQDQINLPQNVRVMSDLVLSCDVCGLQEELPNHCGYPMSPNDGHLVCWMGSNCMSIEFPTHCGETMLLEFTTSTQ